MTKAKILKTLIKNYNYIFERILKGYELTIGSFLFHNYFYDYLEYKNNNGSIRISLEDNNTIKVLKKENNKQIVETITFEYDEIISREKVRNTNIKEEVIRTYQDNKLCSLDSFLTIKQEDKNETIIKIHIEENKVFVNDRDISPLYLSYKNDIEKKYASLKNNYATSKNPNRIFIPTKTKLTKSKHELALEEQIRTYIREEFGYNAKLENKNLEELTKILNMLIKRREYQSQKVKQLKKES